MPMAEPGKDFDHADAMLLRVSFSIKISAFAVHRRTARQNSRGAALVIS